MSIFDSIHQGYAIERGIVDALGEYVKTQHAQRLLIAATIKALEAQTKLAETTIDETLPFGVKGSKKERDRI